MTHQELGPLQDRIAPERLPGDKQEVDVSPFFEYLKTEQGYKVVTRILDIVDDVKKATIMQTTAHVKIEKWVQLAIILAVVGATSVLTAMDKFDPSVGVLFGTLVGYLFGRRR